MTSTGGLHSSSGSPESSYLLSLHLQLFIKQNPTTHLLGDCEKLIWCFWTSVSSCEVEDNDASSQSGKHRVDDNNVPHSLPSLQQPFVFTRFFLSQGICTFCSLCLEHFSMTLHKVVLFLFTEAFSGHRIYMWLPLSFSVPGSYLFPSSIFNIIFFSNSYIL